MMTTTMSSPSPPRSSPTAAPTSSGGQWTWSCSEANSSRASWDFLLPLLRFLPLLLPATSSPAAPGPSGRGQARCSLHAIHCWALGPLWGTTVESHYCHFGHLLFFPLLGPSGCSMADAASTCQRFMPTMRCDLHHLLGCLSLCRLACLETALFLFQCYTPSMFISLTPSACRLVRQESALWSRLHVGVLTTGCLADLLGLKEVGAAGFLRSGGAGMVGHSHLLDACARLRQAPDRMWRAHYPGCTDDSSGNSGDTELPCSGCKHAGLLAAVQRYHMGGTEVHRDGTDVPIARRQGEAAAEAQAGMNASGGKAAPKGRAAACRRRCTAAAAGGLQGVRLAWGKTQEGSALMALLRLMPCSTLHEVSERTGSVGQRRDLGPEGT